MEIHSWCESSFPPLPVACHLAGGAMQTPCTILRRRTERQLTAKAGGCGWSNGSSGCCGARWLPLVARVATLAASRWPIA